MAGSGSSSGDWPCPSATGGADRMVQQVDGTLLIVKDSSLQVVDEPYIMVHSHSDSDLPSSMSSASRDDEGASVRSADLQREGECAAGPPIHLIYDSDNSSSPRHRCFVSRQNSLGTEDDSVSAAGSGRSRDFHHARSQQPSGLAHGDAGQSQENVATEVGQQPPPCAEGRAALADLRVAGGTDMLNDIQGLLADSGGGQQETARSAAGEGGLAPSGQPYGRSRGSVRHAEGKCKPCVYMASHAGCANGYGCRFCHLMHNVKRRTRPSKNTRMQCRQLVSSLEWVFGHDEDRVAQAATAMAGDTTYMRNILKARSRQQGATDAQTGVCQSSGSAAASSPGLGQWGSGLALREHYQLFPQAQQQPLPWATSESVGRCEAPKNYQ